MNTSARWAFGITLSLGSAGVGAALHAMAERHDFSSSLGAVLQHAAIDVERGHGADQLEALRDACSRIEDSTLKSQALALLATAAEQAGDFAGADAAARARLALTQDAPTRRELTLQRIG